jgi:hypothetical protein
MNQHIKKYSTQPMDSAPIKVERRDAQGLGTTSMLLLLELYSN